MRIDFCLLRQAMCNWTCWLSILSVTEEFVDYSLSRSHLQSLCAEGLKVSAQWQTDG